MAHKKAGGSTKNGRDSQAKRRGVKMYAGESVISGNVLIRQKGSNFIAGSNVGMGRDFTLFAMADGIVKFTEKNVKKFNGRRYKRHLIHVLPANNNA
jgi:large subunit ribosomal protein L27